MAYNLKNRNFLKLLDFTPKEIQYLLDLAAELKKAKYAGTEQPRLKGKNIALIFEKTSTRTRCSFEVAAYDQGAHATYLGPTGSQIGVKESMKDTARVGHRGRTGQVRRRPRVERPHQRVPPHTDSGRFPHHA